MADAWKSMKVETFEHVFVTPSVALLRVSGKPPRRPSRSGPRPVLLADDGQSISRFAAIPSPADERGVLRAAYSVNADLIAPATSFSLELSGGGVVALPSPSSGAARIHHEPDAEPADVLDDTPEPPVGTDDRRSDLASKLTELSARVAEAEQARDEVETSAIEARVDAERAKERLVAATDAREELEQSAAPLRAARDYAEQELAEAKATIRTLAAQRDEGDEPLAAGQPTEPFAAVDPAQVQAADERVAQAEAEAERATSALAELETWRGELERRLTETTDELSAARAAREKDEAELSRLGAELGEALALVDLLKAEVQTLNDQIQAAAEVPYSPSERETIARQAGELAALLDNAERVAELAGQLADARGRAESLQAAAGAEPPSPDSTADEPLRVAREELAELREQVAQARAAEAEARIEAIRHAAEAEARELAERELAQAAAAGA